MPSSSATRRASCASSTLQHPRAPLRRVCRSGESARWTPVTSCPASTASAAATAESTPPLIAARTLTTTPVRLRGRSAPRSTALVASAVAPLLARRPRCDAHSLSAPRPRCDAPSLSPHRLPIPARRARSTTGPITSSTASTSASVEVCPRLKRSELRARSGSAPVASSTWLGRATPALQADPVEHSTPRASSSMSSASPSAPGKDRWAFPGSPPGPPATTSSSGAPLSWASGTWAITPATSRSRSTDSRAARSSRSVTARVVATCSPTIAATSRVPERTSRSCPPPCSRGVHSASRRSSRTPAPIGPPSLWPVMVRASTPLAAKSTGTCPTAWTASLCSGTPTSCATSASAARSLTVPISLLAHMTLARATSSPVPSAACSAPGAIRPVGSTGSQVTSAPSCLASHSTLSSTAWCSAGHHAVLDSVEWLAKHDGADVTWLPVEPTGRITPGALHAALGTGEDVALASVMWANNEIGTVSDLAALAEVAHDVGVPLHSDAVQAVGQVPVDFAASGVDALTMTGHKLGGPMGAGVLLLRREAECTPLLHGGGQERDVRSGTLDVAAIVGLQVATTVAVAEREDRADRLAALRDRLGAGVVAQVPDAQLNGAPLDDVVAGGPGRLPGNAHLSFPGAEGDALLMLLDARGIECSTGSACSAGVARPSHVLLAAGADAARARSSLRFSLGHTSTDADVDALLAVIGAVVERARRAGLGSR